jgi:ubiquinone/menaquinone biosynthesis C-methylase UbiE
MTGNEPVQPQSAAPQIVADTVPDAPQVAGAPSPLPPAPGAQSTAFVDVAPLYDHLMHTVPYIEWLNYLVRLLEERRAKPRQVLDLACGTGNVSELLAAEGYRVVGVDLAPGMIAQARSKAAERGLDIEYHVQDAAELDLPGRRFDLCVSLFDSLNYITDPARLAAAMARLAAHLTRNGLFIFDLNSEYALVNNFFDQGNLGTADPLRYDWKSEYFPATRLCRVRMKFWHRQSDGTDRYFEEEHWQYAYRESEIVDMLRDAGFDQIAAYKAYTLRSPVRTSDRIFYVARKATP